MIYLSEMERFTKRYCDMELTCLTVTAHLKTNSHIVNYDPIYLDNLLAWCVVDEATSGQGVPDTPEAYWAPLPLKLADYINELPLWLSSVFVPEGDCIEDVKYHHKRIMSGEWSQTKSLNTNVGRWMERRIPVPTLVSDRLSARCCGNKEEIERLIQKINFLGKHRRVGYGEIARWDVEPGDFTENEIFTLDGVLAHALPTGYDGVKVEALPTIVGWTPPQWKVSLQTEGWPIGTKVLS